MCGSSPSGFTSVEECSLLDQLSKAMCKVADQSYMTVNSSSDVVDCKESIDAHTKAEEKSQKCNNSNSGSNVSGNIDDRKRLLIDPLRIFYEDVGGARELI